MRKIERTNKPDTDRNSEGLETVIERYRQREKTLLPLRINKQVIIFVPKERCNEAYRQEYLMRMNKI